MAKVELKFFYHDVNGQIMEIRIRMEEDVDTTLLFTKFKQQKDTINLYFHLGKRDSNKEWLKLALTAVDFFLPLYMRYTKVTNQMIPFEEFLRKIDNETNLQKIVELIANRDKALKMSKL